MTDPNQIASSERQWRDIAGYEGIYSVSDHGEVISLPRKMLVQKQGVKPYHIAAGGHALNWTYSRKGYPQVGLSKNGVHRTREVHRIVCETFHGPAPDGHEVAHLNGDKTDPRASNLSWATRSENHNHKRDHGTMRTGEAVPNSKLRESDACSIIERQANGESKRSLGREFGISEKAVRKIVAGKMWAKETLAVRAIIERDSNAK